ncbi:MAG TPA: hypothetical protein VHL77_11750 [Ferruginibacter sp.]|nr:hypothetical protein [Ferruginibacter sp.]
MLLNHIGVASFYKGVPVKLCGAIFLCLFFSCKNKPPETAAEIKPEPKIAKIVPPVYVNATNRDLSKHQDTIYYKGKFFTGFRYSLYSNGDTAALDSYFNGVEEGMQRKWYPGHKLQEERFYINGKKEGTHRGWWPDGKEKFYFTVNGDQYEGEFREWYASGLLQKHFHYSNGREEGSQRLWWDNGAVRANYVIRNGKKYGLIGLKTCVNPYVSITKK